MQLVSKLEALRDLRALLADKDHWTKGTTGRTASGEICDSTDSRAVAWCLVGAVYKVTDRHDYQGRHADDLSNELRYTLRGRPASCGLVNFNDNRGTTHGDVLSLIDRTIARLEMDKDG